MKAELLFVVSDVVDSGASGVVLSPGVSDEQLLAIRPGVPIELRSPSGAVFLSRVYGVLTLSPCKSGSGFPIAVPPGISPEQVPIGTEVSLVTHGA